MTNRNKLETKRPLNNAQAINVELFFMTNKIATIGNGQNSVLTNSQVIPMSSLPPSDATDKAGTSHDNKTKNSKHENNESRKIKFNLLTDVKQKKKNIKINTIDVDKNKFMEYTPIDTEYITPYAATLSCIETGLKKARMRYRVMFTTGLVAGLVFSVGGFLCTKIDGLLWADPRERDHNIGIVRMCRGAVNTLGLYFVVTLGIELFNSNVMFLTLGWCVGKLSLIDLIVNWSLVAIGNIASTLFNSYVIIYLTQNKKSDKLVVLGSQYLMNSRLRITAAQNFVRGCSANFIVCMCVYFNTMCKPLHVRFLMIFVGVFAFSTVGFNHIVSELFLMPFSIYNVGSINLAEVQNYDFNKRKPLYYDLLLEGKVDEVKRKLTKRFIVRMFVPSFFGNIVGGVIFAIICPFYLHYYCVKKDMKKEGLKEYVYKDTRPDVNEDSFFAKVRKVRRNRNRSKISL